MLDKSVLLNHFFEFGALDEVIILALNFMWTRFTGSVYGIESQQLVAFAARLRPATLAVDLHLRALSGIETDGKH